MSEQKAKIVIKDLYKVFGADPQSVMPLIRDGLGKQELLDEHNHVLGLQDINLTLNERSIEVIMGLSGSGKSTLIRHINRLLEPTTGEIYIDGEDVLSMSKSQLRELRRKKISMVFQKFALLPHRTILENVTFGLDIQGASSKHKKEQAAHWLERVGLNGFEDNYPRQLSGGMQQRVGLARALATDADILLMDEAFSALDPLIRSDMQDILLALQEELHKTIIFITHDLDEALKIGDRIAILRDGGLVQQGEAKEILLNPADDYVRRFVADVNRAKVLRVRALMSPLSELPSDIDESRAMEVGSRDQVEDVLHNVVLSDPTVIWANNEAGERVGFVTREALAETIGRDDDANWDVQ